MCPPNKYQILYSATAAELTCTIIIAIYIIESSYTTASWKLTCSA